MPLQRRPLGSNGPAISRFARWQRRLRFVITVDFLSFIGLRLRLRLLPLPFIFYISLLFPVTGVMRLGILKADLFAVC